MTILGHIGIDLVALFAGCLDAQIIVHERADEDRRTRAIQLVTSQAGVLLAAYIVKSLPLGAVRWLVVVVVLYAATMLLRAARSREG